MKTAFIFFLLGAIAGAFALYVYQQPAPLSATGATTGTALSAKARTAAEDVGAKTRDTAERMKDSVSEKLVDWHLTSDDIKADLAKTGQVVRAKTATAGDRIADARIVTVVKAKFVLDRDLSALDISIDCRDGAVVLNGVVATPELIGRATALALETDGVHLVTSRLKVKPRAP
jgi:uncharacterized membrane protein